MIQTEMQDYYSIPLGNTKLTNYNFVRDYGKLDSFNENEDEYVTCNVDNSLDGYYITQGIIEKNRYSILSCTNDYRVRIFYDIVLFNIERNINVLEVANMLNIRDAEHQLNRLKAIVHMHHLDYYCKSNNISVAVECRQKPNLALRDIANQNKPEKQSILKMLLERVKPRRSLKIEV